MSSNELNFDKSNQMLQAERNCINFDGSKKFNVNYKAMSYDDKCFIDTDTRSSIGVGNYRLFSPYSCECMIPETVKSATDNVCVPFKNGYGTEQACVVDDGSKLRVGLVRKHPKCNQQLFPRHTLTVPYMGRGYLKPNEESELIFSEDTKVKRSCGMSGISIPNYFTPLLPYLSYNIENPVHLIQEYNDPAWRRGGADTRLVVRDYDLMQRCGKNYHYAYMNKTTNPEFWQNKSQLLQQ
jgi:hypothetical protein